MSKKHPILYEPTTSITDFLIFILGVWFGIQTIPDRFSLFHWVWSSAFFSVAVSGLLGGLSHGFGPKLAQNIKQYLWGLTLFFVGFTGILLGLSGLILIIGEAYLRVIFGITSILLVFYLLSIKKNPTFESAVKFYAPFLILSLVGFGLGVFYFEIIGALFIVVGILVSIGGSLVQVFKISLHQHFNHNDLFHVIQMLGMYLMFRGGLEIPLQ